MVQSRPSTRSKPPMTVTPFRFAYVLDPVLALDDARSIAALSTLELKAPAAINAVPSTTLPIDVA